MADAPDDRQLLEELMVTVDSLSEALEEIGKTTAALAAMPAFTPVHIRRLEAAAAALDTTAITEAAGASADRAARMAVSASLERVTVSLAETTAVMRQALPAVQAGAQWPRRRRWWIGSIAVTAALLGLPGLFVGGVLVGTGVARSLVTGPPDIATESGCLALGAYWVERTDVNGGYLCWMPGR